MKTVEGYYEGGINDLVNDWLRSGVFARFLAWGAGEGQCVLLKQEIMNSSGRVWVEFQMSMRDLCISHFTCHVQFFIYIL